MTKIKMVLPVGKRRAWKLIATPKGMMSWLLKECEGEFTRGNDLVFTWPEGSKERVEVVYVGERHSSLQLDRENRSRVRFYLHGRMTTLTLEVEYRLCNKWAQLQSYELVPWAFGLANLKSVALGGPSLLSGLPDRMRTKGFID
jgi:hypothetical protein